MRKNKQTAQVPESMLPTPEEAVEAYQQTGGHLTSLSEFGTDPLKDRIDLQDARSEGFTSQYPHFQPIFSAAVNGNPEPFKSGLYYLSQSQPAYH